MKTPVEIEALINRLDSLQKKVFEKLDSIDALGDPLEVENVSIEFSRSQISKEITNLILEFEELVAVLDIQIENYTDERLRTLGEIYRAKSLQLKVDLRNTQLKSYKAEEELTHKQRVLRFGKVAERPKTTEEMRKELFGGRLKEEQKKIQEQRVEDQIFEQNKSITASLQSTRQLMTTSIMQTELNIDSLDQQTKDLSTFDTLLTELQTTLKKSRNIVKFIEKQDRADKNRIYLSLGFLMLCCAWVIWRRILKTPVKILLWSFLKIFRIFVWFLPKSEQKVFETPVAVSTVSSVILEASETLSDAYSQTLELVETLSRDELWEIMYNS